MKRLLAAILIAAPLAVLAESAQAQPIAQPFYGRVGVSFLANREARDAAGRTGLHLGGGYRLPTAGVLGAASRPSIDVDLSFHRRSGGRANLIGISYLERVNLGGDVAAAGPRTYAGVGVGIYRIESRGDVGGVRQSTDRTRIGGKLMLGTEFGEQNFAELQYILSGRLIGVRTDSFNLSVGRRF